MLNAKNLVTRALKITRLASLVLLAASTVVSCGKGDSGSGGGAPPIIASAQCTNGQINSQWGCQPQCGGSQVMYGGSCQQIICPANTMMSQWGCQPSAQCGNNGVFYNGTCQVQNGYNNGGYNNGGYNNGGYNNGGYNNGYPQQLPYPYGNQYPTGYPPGSSYNGYPSYFGSYGYPRMHCNSWGLCYTTSGF